VSSWEEQGRLYQQFELCEGSLQELAETENNIPERLIWGYLVDLLQVPPLVISVADPGCLSRILIFTHPGSRLHKQQQKRGGEKICCHTHAIFCSHKFHKIENYFIFDMLKKIIWANFQ
jgi:hypothetical protein